jgi:hypothetical protein
MPGCEYVPGAAIGYLLDGFPNPGNDAEVADDSSAGGRGWFKIVGAALVIIPAGVLIAKVIGKKKIHSV